MESLVPGGKLPDQRDTRRKGRVQGLPRIVAAPQRGNLTGQAARATAGVIIDTASGMVSVFGSLKPATDWRSCSDSEDISPIALAVCAADCAVCTATARIDCMVAAIWLALLDWRLASAEIW